MTDYQNKYIRKVSKKKKKKSRKIFKKKNDRIFYGEANILSFFDPGFEDLNGKI